MSAYTAKNVIRIQTDSVQLQLEVRDQEAGKQYVFIKDSETGQSVRVIKGSQEMVNYIQMISLENGHGYWSIPACESCQGDCTVEYRPCVECLGYGIKL